MSVTIHPTACVAEGAVIGEGSVIGPYCSIGPSVVLGKDVKLLSHVVIEGHTTVEEGCTIYPFASLGQPPQHFGYKQEPTKLTIGAFTTLREHTTLHRGTSMGGGHTQVGKHCFLMVGCHVAHDCHIEDHVTLANNVVLGGHVSIGPHAILGGMTAVHQFVHIGEYAFIGGASGVSGDVIPFAAARGNHACLEGLNIRGLKRHGFQHQEVHALWRLYHVLFSKKETGVSLQQRLSTLSSEFSTFPLAQRLIDFLNSPRQRPLCHVASAASLEKDLDADA
jgi:UDP-N-acetylglucosamine acyltransferase